MWVNKKFFYDLGYHLYRFRLVLLKLIMALRNFLNETLDCEVENLPIVVLLKLLVYPIVVFVVGFMVKLY